MAEAMHNYDCSSREIETGSAKCLPEYFDFGNASFPKPRAYEHDRLADRRSSAGPKGWMAG
jgi:hypothetical protein